MIIFEIFLGRIVRKTGEYLCIFEDLSKILTPKEPKKIHL